MTDEQKEKTSVGPDFSKRKFRPGPEGTCEALLFEFSNERGPLEEGLDSEKGIATTHRIAASSMLEAIEYMAEFESDYRVQTVRTIGMIVMLSGTPYN